MLGFSGVYAIENMVSGNTYIGSARLLRRRFAQHLTALKKQRHQNRHLQYAWNKYGAEAFKFRILFVCAPEAMQFYEQRCLDVLKPAYNQSKSAYSGIPVGAKLSVKHRNKIGAVSKQLWASNDYREKVTSAINQAMTEEEKNKRSMRTKVLWANPEYRAKAIQVRIGRSWNKGFKCNATQIENRRKAARISNMKRNYGDVWKQEYVRRYPQHSSDLDA